MTTEQLTTVAHFISLHGRWDEEDEFQVYRAETGSVFRDRDGMVCIVGVDPEHINEWLTAELRKLT